MSGIRTLGIICALLAATFLAYAPVWRGGLLWDDEAHVTAPSLQTWHGLGQIWFHLGATQQYYPVLHSAFWIEHRLWGDSVLGYHLLNVGLHATAACLFALLLARLRPREPGNRRVPSAAWLAAAVFALHPVCVESVAWISEQKNTLSLVFYLLSALAYLQFDSERRPRWYALGLGLFGLALLSKSVTATLPAALLLALAWRRGKLDWRRDGLPLLPWLLCGLGAGLFTAWVERTYIGARGAAFDLTFVERCFLAGRVVWFYLGKLVWPAELIFTYPRWQVGVDWTWSLGCVGLLVTMGAAWQQRQRSPAPLLALLFFVGSLLPALGFFNVYPFVFSYVADHWQYLPCLGVIAWATGSAATVAERGLRPLRGRHRRGAQLTLAAAAGTVLALLFGLTWRQCGTYRDAATLYSVTLARNPESWMAHNNLGLLLGETGARAEAIAHFRDALRLKPDCADAHNNLGNALAKIPGRTSDAIAEFERALRLQPDFPHAHVNLGWALVNTPGRLADGIEHLTAALHSTADAAVLAEAHFDLGYAFSLLPDRLPDAIREFQTALQLNPNYTTARIGLGTALFRTGRTAEAAIAFEQVLRLQPDHETAHNNLGNVLLQLGRTEEAVVHYRTALRLKPDSVETHVNLALALRRLGEGAEAVTHFQEALRLAPRSAEIWNSLGSTLLAADKPTDALAAFAEAVRFQPDSALFRNNLGLAYLGTGRIDDALAQLREAVRLAPDFADAHYTLGVALDRAGRSAEAATEFSVSGRTFP